MLALTLVSCLAHASVLLMLVPSRTHPAPSSTQHYPAPSRTQHYPAPSTYNPAHARTCVLLTLMLVSCLHCAIQHPSGTIQHPTLSSTQHYPAPSTYNRACASVLLALALVSCSHLCHLAPSSTQHYPAPSGIHYPAPSTYNPAHAHASVLLTLALTLVSCLRSRQCLACTCAIWHPSGTIQHPTLSSTIHL